LANAVASLIKDSKVLTVTGIVLPLYSSEIDLSLKFDQLLEIYSVDSLVNVGFILLLS
jgi:hypothetical protein